VEEELADGVDTAEDRTVVRDDRRARQPGADLALERERPHRRVVAAQLSVEDGRDEENGSRRADRPPDCERAAEPRDRLRHPARVPEPLFASVAVADVDDPGAPAARPLRLPGRDVVEPVLVEVRDRERAPHAERSGLERPDRHRRLERAPVDVLAELEAVRGPVEDDDVVPARRHDVEPVVAVDVSEGDADADAVRRVPGLRRRVVPVDPEPTPRERPVIAAEEDEDLPGESVLVVDRGRPDDVVRVAVVVDVARRDRVAEPAGREDLFGIVAAERVGSTVGPPVALVAERGMLGGRARRRRSAAGPGKEEAGDQDLVHRHHPRPAAIRLGLEAAGVAAASRPGVVTHDRGHAGAAGDRAHADHRSQPPRVTARPQRAAGGQPSMFQGEHARAQRWCCQ
jgi:hypothetical protein